MINLHNKNSSSYVPWSAIDVKTAANTTFKLKNNKEIAISTIYLKQIKT